MTDFLEKCNKIASSKPGERSHRRKVSKRNFTFLLTLSARIFYALLLTAICVLGCVRLLQASNAMHEKNQNKHLSVVLKTESGDFFDFKPKSDENVGEWTSKLDKFFARN